MQACLDAYELIDIKMLTNVFYILNIIVVISCSDRELLCVVQKVA